MVQNVHVHDLASSLSAPSLVVLFCYILLISGQLIVLSDVVMSFLSWKVCKDITVTMKRKKEVLESVPSSPT